MSYLFDVVFLLLLLILSAVFSGTEIAFMALTKAKVRELAESGVKGSKLLAKLRKNPHRLLITILIGNNLVNIGASVYATIIFTEMLGTSSGVGVATGVMTFLVLIFGEIMPKTLAHKYRVGFALRMSRPLLFCQYLFYPFVVVLDLVISRFSKKGELPDADTALSTGEIKAMMDLGVEEGAIDEKESELIENVLEFSDITVETVMTPRVKIDALDEKTSLKETAQYIVDHTHSRIPVFRETIDNVVGYVSVRDVLNSLHDGEDLGKKLKSLKLSKTLNVPYTYRIDRLFRQFQQKGVHLAIVRDEFGGVMGLVTLEDLLEEIVGEIVDESDREQNWILAKGNNWVRVHGGAPLEAISDCFEIEFPGDSHDPISGAILEKLERFPTANEVIDFDDFEVKIMKMKSSAIEEVKVSLK